MQNSTMITLKKVSFSYPRAKENIFSDLEFSITKGGVHGLIGPNGAGKTTFFDLIAGFHTAKSGEIHLECEKNEIILLPQNIEMPKVLTVAQTLDFLLALRPERLDKAQERFLSSMSREELARFEKIRNHRFGHLSGGEKAWFLCNIFLSFPGKIVFLDEPTVGIDPLFRIAIWNRIDTEVSRGKTIFVSSHILSEMRHRVGLLHFLFKGKIVSFENMSAFLKNFETEDPDEAFVRACGYNVTDSPFRSKEG